MTMSSASFYLLGTSFLEHLFVGGFGGVASSCTEFSAEMSSHVWPACAMLSHACMVDFTHDRSFEGFEQHLAVVLSGMVPRRIGGSVRS
jgi:hypothetical protein